MQWLSIYMFKSSLAGHLIKGSVHWKEGPQYVDVQGSVHREGCTVGVSVYWRCKFFLFIFEIDQSETTKSHIRH